MLYRKKNEDETSAHPAISSSTIPLTSGIEEAPQLLLSVTLFYHNSPGKGNKYSIPLSSSVLIWLMFISLADSQMIG